MSFVKNVYIFFSPGIFGYGDNTKIISTLAPYFGDVPKTIVDAIYAKKSIKSRFHVFNSLPLNSHIDNSIISYNELKNIIKDEVYDIILIGHSLGSRVIFEIQKLLLNDHSKGNFLNITLKSIISLSSVNNGAQLASSVVDYDYLKKLIYTSPGVLAIEAAILTTLIEKYSKMLFNKSPISLQLDTKNTIIYDLIAPANYQPFLKFGKNAYDSIRTETAIKENDTTDYKDFVNYLNVISWSDLDRYVTFCMSTITNPNINTSSHFIQQIIKYLYSNNLLPIYNYSNNYYDLPYLNILKELNIQYTSINDNLVTIFDQMVRIPFNQIDDKSNYKDLRDILKIKNPILIENDDNKLEVLTKFFEYFGFKIQTYKNIDFDRNIFSYDEDKQSLKNSDNSDTRDNIHNIVLNNISHDDILTLSNKNYLTRLIIQYICNLY